MFYDNRTIYTVPVARDMTKIEFYAALIVSNMAARGCFSNPDEYIIICQQAVELAETLSGALSARTS
jgi:hypothetical protein